MKFKIGERYLYKDYNNGCVEILFEVVNLKTFKVIKKIKGCDCSGCLKNQNISLYNDKHLNKLRNQNNPDALTE